MQKAGLWSWGSGGAAPLGPSTHQAGECDHLYSLSQRCPGALKKELQEHIGQRVEALWEASS